MRAHNSLRSLEFNYIPDLERRMELEFKILKMEYVISLTTITHKCLYIWKPYFVSLNVHIYKYVNNYIVACFYS
jgi:hypothetical protein